MDQLTQVPPWPGVLHAEIQGLGWLGEPDAALVTAKRAAAGGDPPALEDLAQILVAAGRLDEAEAVLRRLDLTGPGERRLLGNLLLLEGRGKEAAPYLVTSPPKIEDQNARAFDAYRRAIPLSWARNAQGVRRVADEVRSFSREAAANFAALLAYAGDVEGALALVPDLKGSPANRDVVRAIAAWRTAGAGSALATLHQTVSGDLQIGTELLAPEAPWWLVAECAWEAGDAGTALTAVKRFQRFYFPLGHWRAWAYPRSLVMEARANARTGRLRDANAALDQFERLWRRADPDQPLLAEARALRRGLAGEQAARMRGAESH
jgi:hypothetical protein